MGDDAAGNFYCSMFGKRRLPVLLELGDMDLFHGALEKYVEGSSQYTGGRDTLCMNDHPTE